MSLRMTKPGSDELMEKYVGKKFRYHSKYGGVIENIICEDISITETIEHKNGDTYVELCEIYIISDKRNSYNLNEVEFYEKVN